MSRALRDKIINWLMVLVPLTLLILVVSCNKDRAKSSTPEPIVQHDVVIDWNWDDNLGWAPPMDTIKKYAKDKYVANIFVNLVSQNSTALPVFGFRIARDTLQTRIDVAPTRVRGMGTIYPRAANVPEFDPYAGGMCIEDSLWFTSHGWAVQRYQHKKQK